MSQRHRNRDARERVFLEANLARARSDEQERGTWRSVCVQPGPENTRNVRIVACVFFFLCLAVFVVWRIDFSQIHIPICSFYLVTGFRCPGCGGLRAAHALLHGDIAGAWKYNPLVVLLGPWFAYGVIMWAGANVSGCALWPGRWLYSLPFLVLIGIGAIIFAVLRNLFSA